MATFEPQDDYNFDGARPPRPTTPPVRRGFLLILAVLTLAASLVYGLPYVADRAGYAWEAGRSRAASEALSKLDEAGVVGKASGLFRMATRAVAPAVVHISTRRRREGPAAAALPGAGAGVPLGPGFAPLGVGSGVVIDKAKGLIVTNFHVVRGADQIAVRLGRGMEMAAREVGHDEKSDLAVLQVRGPLRVAAAWGDSDKLDTGDWVLAIGCPFNLEQTVTAGIVSATGRNNLGIVGDDSYEDFIQTDAAINPGNSGGPLVDLSGKVVGINTAIFSESGGYQGIGLAISASMARRVVEQIIEHGKPIRGYLGVQIQTLTPALAKQFGVADGRGALVQDVQAGSPAEKAGLKSGDVIVGVAGKAIDSSQGLKNRTASLEIGSKVAVAILRGGESKSIDVTIGELPTEPVVASALGFGVREIGPKQSGLAEPVVLIDQVSPGSPAWQAGLRRGLRIVGVGRDPVKNQADYDLAMAKVVPAEGLVLQIMLPDNSTRFVTVGGPPADVRP